MKKITIVVAPDGGVTVEAHGFTGAACLKATEEIEKAIGVVKDRKNKSEMGRVEQKATINQS